MWTSRPQQAAPASRARPPQERRAFSLLELMTVVVILGVIAAMAVARFGHDALGVAEGSRFLQIRCDYQKR